MRKRRHILTVEIEVDWAEGQRQAQARLHRWLEGCGHTTRNSGFIIKNVGVITGKHVHNQHEGCHELAREPDQGNARKGSSGKKRNRKDD